MLKLDPTVQTLSAAGIIAIAISVLLNGTLSLHGEEQKAAATPAAATTQAANASQGLWAASATGRVEPKEGEIRIVAQTPGKIVEVAVKANDRVATGDLLVRLDDEDMLARLDAAAAEEAVRVRERDEEDGGDKPAADKPADAAKPAAGAKAAADTRTPGQRRRSADDAESAAERARFTARLALDAVVSKSHAGPAPADDVAAARTKFDEANTKVAAARELVAKINAEADMPLPTRLESAVTIARSDLAQVENAIERTRVRAPSDGTVLNVWAKVGESAAPSPEAALVLFGDITGLRVRTEVEERDVVKVKVGQRVVVRADAFPGKDFEGVVTSLAPALGPPRILSRGPRRPNDVEVLEAMIALDGQPPLLTGMRVDVFFKNEGPAT